MAELTDLADLAARKAALRARVLRARERMAPADRLAAADAVCAEILGTPEVVTARAVAAYVSFGTEVGTDRLLGALAAGGARVLLPVLLDDGDLDWAVYEGPETLRRAERGPAEPAGPRLGVHAAAEADALIVPALAVDGRGVRLGRGGGSYDRVLARLAPGRFTAALLYDPELVDEVPAGPHDRQVSAAMTPSGTHRFR